MEPDSSSQCPSCGTLLDQDADSLSSGLCPRCLLEGSLISTIAGDLSPSTPPAVDRVAEAFPDLEVIELIGSGGMGAVYKARQKSLDRFVALKLLPLSLACDEEFAKRFEAEAKALAALNHPNIVTVHEFGQQGDFYFLLMEYVDGPNLRNLLVDQRLSPDEALSIIPPLCEALEFAHQRNVVHCDIKPENLLLNTDGQVKIADFGVARILGQSTPGEESEKVAGTPAYMAPEQIESPQAIDTRADIYSLGVVFYEMLTGERPNHRLTPPSGKNPSLDVRLDEVVLRALEANPNFRWQSANELNSELQTILTENLGAPKIAPPENLPNSSLGWAWVSCLLALVAMSGLGVAFVAHHHLTPVPESEHQAAIDRYFEHKLHLTDLRHQFDALEAKPERTPAEDEKKQELWEQVSEGFTMLELFGELRGVNEPRLNSQGYLVALMFSVLQGMAASLLGLRHLSWLRGQEEPLSGLKPALVGVILVPLLFPLGLLLRTVFRYESLVPNAVALAGALLLILWVVGRLVAWTRNLRQPPSLGVSPIVATVLIGWTIAIPFTAAQKGYSAEVWEVGNEMRDKEQSHQEFFAYLEPDELLPGSEELAEARQGCEDYARQAQSLQLLQARPFPFGAPKGDDWIHDLAWPFLALVVGLVVRRKLRHHRA